MMRCIGIRTALLTGLVMTAAASMHGSASAEQGDAPVRFEIRDAAEPVFVRLRDVDADSDDVMFAQLQPPPADEPGATVRRPSPKPAPMERPGDAVGRPRAERPPRDLLALFSSRRRRPLATVPYMFGDFFGDGGGQAVVTLPPITSVVTDGAFDLFVTNAGGTNGANTNPAVPILVSDGPAGALLVATSIGNGLDLSGDGQPDTYPISSPNVPGLLPPPVPCPGTLVYTGGNAVFADAQGNPLDGSAGQGDGWSLVANYVCNPSQFVVNVPYSGGAAVRRAKLSENNSPEPRDRLFFNFNFYNDVIGGLGDVSQYTFGYERTVLQGSSSIEVRFPFAATLDSDQVAGTAARDIEAGNLFLSFKSILYEVPTGLISAGLGIALPTSSPTRLSIAQTPILEIDSTAVHLLPFLATMSAPHDRWFWQAFLQLDVDANGNRVRGDVRGQDLSQFGVLQDATLLFADASVGYAAYENLGACGITRISPTAELHYSTTLQDTDVATGNGFLIRSPTPRFDVLNLTLGTSVLWRDHLWIRPAMAIPLRDGDDEHFDYEAMVQVDWRL